MYVPSRRPANATDLPLDRESVGVNGENTEPLGETTNTVGHRSPKEQVTSASNCPAPATDFGERRGPPRFDLAHQVGDQLAQLGAASRFGKSRVSLSMTRARQRSDSNVNSSDCG